MPQKTLLLYGAPTRTRDLYELLLLRAGHKVVVCSDPSAAAQATTHHEIGTIAICGMQPAQEQLDLLQLVQNLAVKPPVFFLREQRPQDDLALERDDPAADVTLDFARELEQVMAGLHESEPKHSPTRQTRHFVQINRVDYPHDYARANELFEFEWLTEILRAYRGNISRAANGVRLARRSLQLKIRHHGINMKAIRRTTNEAELDDE